MPLVEFTHALPFQYCPEGHDVVVYVPPEPEHPDVVTVSPDFADFVIWPSQKTALPDESLYM